ncbi:hypothetical protein HYALB_00009618 [Hymenoscyphus albidus]|uniref:Uncharacterized protein n=1 Tax=Hymenoscyphus albidus TaxID=595503 RepID=A0A9N9QBL9_9HELO|nr:hypothetical protein HYALB_00009618 [Hymenoscyphus albidus]
MHKIPSAEKQQNKSGAEQIPVYQRYLQHSLLFLISNNPLLQTYPLTNPTTVPFRLLVETLNSSTHSTTSSLHSTALHSLAILAKTYAISTSAKFFAGQVLGPYPKGI